MKIWQLILPIGLSAGRSKRCAGHERKDDVSPIPGKCDPADIVQFQAEDTPNGKILKITKNRGHKKHNF